jgi:hypothetical protein
MGERYGNIGLSIYVGPVWILSQGLELELVVSIVTIHRGVLFK